MLRSGLKQQQKTKKTAKIFLLFNLSPAVQIYISHIYIKINIISNVWKCSTDSQKVAVDPQLNTGGFLQ